MQERVSQSARLRSLVNHCSRRHHVTRFDHFHVLGVTGALHHAHRRSLAPQQILRRLRPGNDLGLRGLGLPGEGGFKGLDELDSHAVEGGDISVDLGLGDLHGRAREAKNRDTGGFQFSLLGELDVIAGLDELILLVPDMLIDAHIRGGHTCRGGPVFGRREIGGPFAVPSTFRRPH